MRWLAFIGSLCLFPNAHASFEVLLIPDSSGRLQRVDPVSQVTLGNFSTFSSATTAFVTNQNEVFVASSTGFTSYEIGTGQQTRAFTFSQWSSSIISNGNSLFAINSAGDQTRAYNLTTGTTAGIGGPVGVTMLESVNRGLTTSITYGRDTSNRLVTQVMSSSGAVSGTTTLTGISSASFSIGSIAHLRGLDYFAYIDGGAVRMTWGSGTSYQFHTDNVSSLFGAGIIPGVVRGHENLYMVGSSSTAGRTRIIRYGVSSTTGSVLQMSNFEANFTPAANMNPGIVVAPEPGTMAALGLGLVALLKRRRKTS